MAKMRGLIPGFSITRSIAAAAELGIADLLAYSQRTAAELASACGVLERPLYRMLRALAGEGVFVEKNDGRFALTPLAELLRADYPGSIRDWAIYLADLPYRSSFEMLHSLRTGESAFRNRLARSTRDLLNTMETINEAGGKFQSISEPWANTTTHAGKMIMTVFAGNAEFERDLIRERAGAGREAAKQRGVRFGRPRKLSPDQAQVATQLLAEGKAVRDIARTFNVHEATIYRLAAAS